MKKELYLSKEDKIKNIENKLLLSDKEQRIIYEMKMKKLNKLFIEYCKQQDFEMIQYLLTSPDLELKYDLSFNNEGFKYLCEKGAVEIIDYLATSPELDKHINITDGSNVALAIACERGQLELVKYLLTSSQLKKHANLYDYNERALITAYKYKENIFDYLLNEYGIKSDLISEKTQQDNPELMKILKSKEFNKNLNKDLPLAKEQHKPKI